MRRIAVLAALLGAACATGRLEDVRTLPADRAAAVLYVALGDSTVEGVGATSPDRNYVSQLHERLRAVYPNARVINLGVGGATSADVLLRQVGRAIEQRPQLVTGRLRYETTAVIVVNLIPDLAVTPRFSRSRARDAVGRRTVAFNEAIERRGRAHGAELVDLYAVSQREVPLRPELIWSDGYHPSDLGYARWAELVWAGVESRIAMR